MHATRLRTLILLGSLLASTAFASSVVDIPVMTWTPRSDWLNVKSAPYNAVGDGVVDDTAAIRAALTGAGRRRSATPTVYFPPGTYKITATLDWQGANTDKDWSHGTGGCALIGCGRKTVIKWAGPGGAAMFWTKGATITRYIGLAWDGNNSASCAYEASSPMVYEYSCRHENESFRNFTVPGTYIPGKPQPAAGIIAGQSIEHNSPDAEVMIWNCLFVNCSTAIDVAQIQYNNYVWEIKGCEFEKCGVGVLSNAGKFLALDCHFQASVVADISANPDGAPRIRRCTSTGSGMFYYSNTGRGVGAKLIQDCRIDSWTNPEGAIRTGNVGPSEILDCVFTNPPKGDRKNPNSSPILMNNNKAHPAFITVSNNSCPAVSGEHLVNLGPNPPANLVSIPAGKVPPIISQGSADLTFLHTADWNDSTHIIDVTQAPYGADKTGVADATSAIQNAVNDGARAGDGALVYIPVGRYRVSNTINVTGANYTIQGAGCGSMLVWHGEDNGTFFNVVSPQKLSMEQMQFAFASPHDDKLKDVTAINETSSAPCTMNYDGLYYNQNGMGEGIRHTPDASGLKLTSLPAGSRVTAGHIALPLTIHDCGAAEILLNYSIGGRIILDGATQPRTGFLGIINGENGTLTAGPDIWNIFVNDNQSLVYGDYYQEQGHNCIKLARGAGKEPGHVTITGMKQQNFNPDNTWDVVHIDNYSGRFFYGQVLFANSANNPTNIVLVGSNPCDVIMDSVCFGADNVPVLKLDKGGNLIQLNNVHSLQPVAVCLPNVQPKGWGAAAVAALDDERRLGQYDLDWNYGITRTKSSVSK